MSNIPRIDEIKMTDESDHIDVNTNTYLESLQNNKKKTIKKKSPLNMVAD